MFASARFVARSLLCVVVASCAPETVREARPLRIVEMALSSAVSTRLTDAPPRVVRRDITVSRDGLRASLDDALIEQLDRAFIRRLDLYAHVRGGDAITLWLRDRELVAAQLRLGDEVLLAALYEGALAPRGFYDADGHSTDSALRSRPIDLGRITSRFGQRFDVFTGAAGFHRGVDYGVPIGTPVVAVGAGRVKAVGHSERAGNFIKLAHAAGYESAYLHLDRVHVKAGDVVAANDVIALSGNTGRSTGPHLHYELRLAGIALDPLASMPPSSVALGPIARRQHLAFIKNLQQMESTDEKE